MALRPVSELGLMDLTDLAEREESGIPDPQTNPQAQQIDEQPQGGGTTSKPKASGGTNGKKAARTGSSAKRSGDVKPAAAKRRTNSAPQRAASLEAPVQSSSRNPERTAKIGISLLAGAVGVAAGVLLSRNE